jgi:hypothetical protein
MIARVLMPSRRIQAAEPWRRVGFDDRAGVDALAQDPGDAPPAVSAGGQKCREIHRMGAAHHHVRAKLPDQIELMKRHQGDAGEDAAEVRPGRIARPVERGPGQEDPAHLAGSQACQEHARRVNLAVECPTARQQANPGVQPAGPQMGDEGQHRALGTAAVQRGEQKQDTRRRLGRCPPVSAQRRFT